MTRGEREAVRILARGETHSQMRKATLEIWLRIGWTCGNQLNSENMCWNISHPIVLRNHVRLMGDIIAACNQNLQKRNLRGNCMIGHFLHTTNASCGAIRMRMRRVHIAAEANTLRKPVRTFFLGSPRGTRGPELKASHLCLPV